MERTLSTGALVALEDAAPDLLFESLPGTDIPWWPLFRFPLGHALAVGEIGSGGSTPHTSRLKKLNRVRNAVLPDSHASRRLRRQADHLFVLSGTTNVRPAGGGLRNWLAQPHAEALGHDAVVLQDAPYSNDRATRPSFAETYSFEDAIVRTELANRLKPPPKARLDGARELARAVIDRLDVPLDAGRGERAIRFLLERAWRAEHVRGEFERVIDRVKPKAVYMQTAAYGDRSHLIRLLRDRGIVVAELQHGWIGPSHAAYNYGAAVRDPRLERSLPDTLLTFGDYWAGGVDAPFDTVTIGKPHLDAARVDLPPLAARDKRVLVASAATETTATEEYVLAVRDALPSDWRVAFRVHPMERAHIAERYPRLVSADRVEIDREPDVYASLRASRGVTGESSTVLWEALAMGCPVIVRDSPLRDFYIDDAVFGETVRVGDGLRTRLADLAGAHPPVVDKATLDAIWAPDSVSRFVEYADRFSA